jgi:hypothetical protein
MPRPAGFSLHFIEALKVGEIDRAWMDAHAKKERLALVLLAYHPISEDCYEDKQHDNDGVSDHELLLVASRAAPLVRRPSSWTRCLLTPIAQFAKERRWSHKECGQACQDFTGETTRRRETEAEPRKGV